MRWVENYYQSVKPLEPGTRHFVYTRVEVAVGKELKPKPPFPPSLSSSCFSNFSNLLTSVSVTLKGDNPSTNQLFPIFFWTGLSQLHLGSLEAAGSLLTLCPPRSLGFNGDSKLMSYRRSFVLIIPGRRTTGTVGGAGLLHPPIGAMGRPFAADELAGCPDARLPQPLASP